MSVVYPGPTWGSALTVARSGVIGCQCRSQTYDLRIGAGQGPTPLSTKVSWIPQTKGPLSAIE